MRLLWISHLVPYPPKGGVAQRSYHLLREAARRHEVDFAGLAQPSQQSSDQELSEAEQELAKFCRDVSTCWIRSDLRPWGRSRLLVRSFLSSRPYDVNWLADQVFERRMRRRRRPYDLVHVDTIGLTPYTEEFSGTPFVLNHHNVESQMMQQRAAKVRNPLKRVYLVRESRKLGGWERRWTPLAALNIVVSALDRERLLEGNPGAAVEIVENGVDVEYFSPETGPEDHDGYLVWVGGMSWYPNRDAVLWFVRDIWPRLLEDRPDRQAVLVGRDPPAEVRNAPRGGALRAPGFVDDIRPVVDRALAYVCPIRTGGGTRLKILDALAMAKPLVATSFAVQGLGLERGTHYLCAESPPEYVEQIGRLEEDPSLRRRLGHAGRELVERRYAWDVVGRNLERAYRRAVGETD